MPRFEFPKEYSKEESEKNKRLNKPGENKKSIEDLTPADLTPEEIAIIEEAKLQEEILKKKSNYPNQKTDLPKKIQRS